MHANHLMRDTERYVTTVSAARIIKTKKAQRMQTEYVIYLKCSLGKNILVVKGKYRLHGDFNWCETESAVHSSMNAFKGDTRK